MTPRFLTVEEILDLHKRGTDRYGGSHGARDPGFVESAAMAPQASFGGEYLLGGLAEMAASYWFNLTNNHGFVDGNKRVGLRAADVFLISNGLLLTLSATEVLHLSQQVARAEITREELGATIRENLRPL